MEREKKRKPTQEEKDKALNRELTDAVAVLCGERFKVLVLPLNKEQVFLKLLRKVLPSAAAGDALMNALLDADLPVLCELSAIIAANSGVELSAADILERGRLADIVTAIQIQLDENGYLDFLLRMATVIPEILIAKS